MKNIFLISTQEESNLYIWDNKLIFAGYVTTRKHLAIDNQFIYITDDSEIKTNDYYINYSNRPYVNCSGSTIFEGLYDNCSKIIATNDLGVIDTGVQQLTEGQLQEYCSNPVDSVEVNNFFSFSFAETIKQVVEYFNTTKPNNNELEESVRQIFMDETKNKLWAENKDNDCGFSEEYVFWLEEKVINSAKKELKTEKLYTKEQLLKAYCDGMKTDYSITTPLKEGNEILKDWLKTIK